MINEKLRKYAKAHNVYLWEIAKHLNVSEMTITRRFRNEFTDEEFSEMKAIIDRIAKQKEANI